MSEVPSASTASERPLRILQVVPNKVYNRLIVRYPHQTDRDYSVFYHEAANRLAGTYTGSSIDDALLMPFLMLYRQAFELQLKNFIRYLASVRRRRDGSSRPNTHLVQEVIEKTLQNDIRHNLAKLLNELLKHYDALDLPEDFPESVKTLIRLLHDADNSGTAFRYAGQMPVSQDNADFPDLAAMLDEEFRLLQAVEDWIYEMDAAAPDPEEFC